MRLDTVHGHDKTAESRAACPSRAGSHPVQRPLQHRRVVSVQVVTLPSVNTSVQCLLTNASVRFATSRTADNQHLKMHFLLAILFALLATARLAATAPLTTGDGTDAAGAIAGSAVSGASRFGGGPGIDHSVAGIIDR